MHLISSPHFISLLYVILTLLNSSSFSYTFCGNASYAISKHMLYHKKIEDVKMDLALMAIELSENQNDSYKNRLIAVMKADMLGRDLPEFTSEIEHFNIFKQYLERLIEKAKTISVADLPDFAEVLNKVKKHQLPPSMIKEIYAEKIIKETENISV